LVIFNLEDVHCAYGEYMLNSEIVDQNQKFWNPCFLPYIGLNDQKPSHATVSLNIGFLLTSFIL
jgi:hypothetical protein